MIEPVSHEELCRDGKPIYISALHVDDQTIDLAIDLEPEAQLSHRPLYRLSEYELEILHEYLNECLRTGFIRPSIHGSNGCTSPFRAEEGWWATHVHGLSRVERQISQESIPAAAYRQHTSPARRSKVIHRTRPDKYVSSSGKPPSARRWVPLNT